jgi:hypothetical protein
MMWKGLEMVGCFSPMAVDMATPDIIVRRDLLTGANYRRVYGPARASGATEFEMVYWNGQGWRRVPGKRNRLFNGPRVWVTGDVL